MNRLARARGILVALGIVLACGYVGLHLWRERAAERRLISASHVSVVDVRTAFPPALIIEFENAGEVPIQRTHFRLSFEAEGHEISRADEDVLSVRPGEKRRVVLRSHSSGPSPIRASGWVQARYELVVLPEWIRGVPVISGELLLQR